MVFYNTPNKRNPYEAVTPPFPVGDQLSLQNHITYVICF